MSGEDHAQLNSILDDALDGFEVLPAPATATPTPAQPPAVPAGAAAVAGPPATARTAEPQPAAKPQAPPGARAAASKSAPARFDPLAKRTGRKARGTQQATGVQRQAQGGGSGGSAEAAHSATRAPVATGAAGSGDAPGIDSIAQDLAELLSGLADMPDAQAATASGNVDGSAQAAAGAPPAAAPATTQRAQFAETLSQLSEAAATARGTGGAGGRGGNESASAGGGQEGLDTMLPQLVASMAKALGGDGQGSGEGEEQWVEGLMRQLLCKSVLYEPMKEMQKEYPTWLEKNGESLTSEQRSMYEAQQAHVDAVCRHLEEHGDSKFERLQELLQELQGLGQPPEDMLKGLQLSGNGAGGATPMPGANGGGVPDCLMQ